MRALHVLLGNRGSACAAATSLQSWNSIYPAVSQNDNHCANVQAVIIEKYADPAARRFDDRSATPWNAARAENRPANQTACASH
jgi:hypothetical protein